MRKCPTNLLLILAGTLWTICVPLAGAQNLTISEFMAMNDSGLKDEDGAASDWLEIVNAGNAAVNLQGWFLTDDPANRTRWAFPARSLGAGAYLVVFTSGKNRRPAQGNLHTDFRLASEGGYLALVRPDGVTVQKEFAPYPRQRPNISYGTRLEEIKTTLVAEDAPARILLPENNDAGTRWTGGQEPFDDQAWRPGQNGAGFLVSVPGFAVQNFKSAALVEDLGAAEEVIVTPALQAGLAVENAPVLEYLGTDDPGHYSLNRPFPGTAAGQDVDNFVILATAKVTIPSAGDWTFGVLSDDGFGLALSRGGQVYEMSYPSPRGPSDSLQTFQLPAAGGYELRLVYYESGGGSALELFAAQGSYTAWDDAHFRLVGDTAAGGLAVSSPPVSAAGSASFLDFIHTDLRDTMPAQHSTACLRIPFQVADAAAIKSLILGVRYDDGLVAYLNGAEAARRNAPNPAAFDSTALTNRAAGQALVAERMPLDAAVLRTGANILAIQALNDRVDSPDFLISATLENVLIASSVEGYCDQPTPGAANSGVFFGFAEPPVFSVQRGFQPQPFDLALQSATAGATLRYTTNGTPPSATNGTVYSAPLRIARTTVARAAAFKDGHRPSSVETHSYLFLEDIIKQDSAATLAAGFPSSWNGTAPDYGLDKRVAGQNGADSYGGKYARTIREDLCSIPTLSLVMDLQEMFGAKGIYSNPQNRGAAWEKGVSAELFPPDGPAGFQVDAGLSIQGGAFRGFGLTRKKSFRLLFKSIYGPARLHYPFFGPEAADEFDSLTLRANNNDGYQWDSAAGKALYIRDGFALASAREMGMTVSHSSYVHLYINGFYWGLYNPVERPDAAFGATYFDAAREDWDAINYDSAPDGNYNAWNRLLALANSGLANQTNYCRIQGRNPDGSRNPGYENLLDVDNLIDYILINIYGGNEDWPGRNWYAGRSRTGLDGFRFFPWDTEATLGLWATLNSDRTSASGAVATPYAAARSNADFRMKFADHVYKHFYNGGVYYVDPANPAWDAAHPERNRPAARFAALASRVERAMVGESARWGDQHASTPYTRDEHWAVEKTNLLKNYFPKRSAVVLDQLRRAGLYPRTEPPVFNQRGGPVPAGFQLSLVATQGVVYYTTNGSDPRMPVTVSELSRSTLVGNPAPRRVLIPSAANGGSTLGAAWRGGAEPFNDAAWTGGTGGVGYDREATYLSYIQTDVKSAMDNQNTSAFIRIPFVCDSASRQKWNYLTLRMRYDDGFVAFLNGVQVAAANPPASLAWNSAAAAQNADTAAVLFEDFKVDDFLPALKSGANILAIQGLNLGLSSTDFLIDPELVAGERQQSTSTNAALVYSQPLVLNDFTIVKARVLNGTEWSALNEARFVVGQPRLAVSELHYHPADPSPAEVAAGYTNADDFEYIELANPGAQTCDLEGFRFTSAISFEFSGSKITTLAPGGFVLVVKNQAAFEKRYGPGRPVAGEYSGRFDNAGEHVVAVDADGQVVIDFTYGTQPPWPQAPDGQGPSLEPVDPAGDLNAPSNWRISALPGGSPGLANPPAITLSQPVLEGAQLRFQFPGVKNQGYTIYARDSWSGDSWQVWKKGEVLASDSPVEVRLEIPSGAPTRFFRISIP